MDTKTCRICWADKPYDAFTIKASSGDGLSPYCKDCQRARRASRKGPAKLRPVKVAGAGIALRSAGQTTDSATDYIMPRDVTATWAAVQMIAKDGDHAPNLFFVGPSGSGKTECAKALARVSGLPFFHVDAPAMTDPEVWFGTRDVVVEDGAPRTVFTPSAFVEALQRPCVLLIDEANRVADAVRGILLAFLDDSRSGTNPLTGQRIERHPECYIVMTGNVGLAFTGTYAVDLAFTTRALTTHFSYLPAKEETALAISRTGCSPEAAELFVRFANETRSRHLADPDFAPVSTREVLTALKLVARGLDETIAARQAIISAASDEGGGDSHRAALEMIWTGVKPR
jgi:MoxR-like ATPase